MELLLQSHLRKMAFSRCSLLLSSASICVLLSGIARLDATYPRWAYLPLLLHLNRFRCPYLHVISDSAVSTCLVWTAQKEHEFACPRAQSTFVQSIVADFHHKWILLRHPMNYAIDYILSLLLQSSRARVASLSRQRVELHASSRLGGSQRRKVRRIGSNVRD